MTGQRTDWLEVWAGLSGSRDFRAVVEAGGQLARALATARETWHAQRAQIASLDEQCEAVLAIVEARADAEAQAAALLAGVVRAWHEIDHVEAWSVCSHMVCRHVLLTYAAEVVPAGVIDVRGPAS